MLANKQSRGAFGQWRMEAIVQDGLPKGAYAFQHTLANKTRPDCCVFLPDKRPLVIDAKFPLEGVTAYRDAKSDDERKAAAQRLRADVSKHVADIADKYLIPGETQEMAFMFVPSELIYAELHDGFDDLVQKAYRARVVVVSPSLLMLAIQVVQQVQRDARMREAADQIRDEVARLVKDVGLLGDRVRKLQTHFNQSNEDIRQAVISIDKIEAHGERIQQVEFDAGAAKPAAWPACRPCAGWKRGVIPVSRCRRKLEAGGVAAHASARRMPPPHLRAIGNSHAHVARPHFHCRYARGLSAAARADRHVSWLLVGPAARARPARRC